LSNRKNGQGCSEWWSAPRIRSSGFCKYFDGRDLLGFVDGTENPVDQNAIDSVIIGDEDADFAGGSYVITQKYLHDLNRWNVVPVGEQENIIGRHKLSDIEQDDAAKAPYAHNVLTTIMENREQLDIVRDNMPFGEIGKGEFGTYFIGYARSPHRIEKMLENMFIGLSPGNYDRLLDFSRAVTGTLFFVPSATFLDNVEPDAAPPLSDSQEAKITEPADKPLTRSPASDGSLGIGSLKGEARHE
jgi:putative iron-dependent peroxidase